MTKDSPPEEKLLNLIKKRKRDKAAQKKDYFQAALPKAAEKAERAKKGISGARLSDIAGTFTLENIRRLNIMLFGALVLILLYFIAEFLFIPNAEIPAVEEVASRSAAAAAEAIKQKPYSYYSKDFNKDMFKPLVQEKRTELQPKVLLEDILNNLSLLGIVSGEQPQAIIEDKKLHKTFFLKEGQSASGILLKKIDDGTATVVYKGEEITLTL